MPDWKVSIGTEDLDHDSFTQGKSSTVAMKGSTEEEQFKKV